MKNRAMRRHKDRVKKEKYKKILKSKKQNPTEREIGKAFTTHDVQCSCNMCCNPRRSNIESDSRTIQEKKSDITFREEVNET